MNDLDKYLASLERSSKFDTVSTLKSTSFETTELVKLNDGISAPGPYIRKQISIESGIGQTYIRLFEEQDQGNAFYTSPYIYECFETEDKLNIVMEYVRGKTLADMIYEVGPSLDIAVDAFPKLCDAVSELHERFNPPIIHRDLKPSNVMINETGVKVIDFGIARTFRDDADSDTKHFGTPSYAPPEQFGFGQTDERSDIYSLGILLYYCLTERTPSPSMLESGLLDDEIPESIGKVIIKAASFDPSNRYSSVRDLKKAFLAAIDKVNVPQMQASNLGWTSIDRSTSEPSKSKTPRIPQILSIIWNVLVLVTWSLLIMSLIYIVISPDETHEYFPRWVLAIEYPMLMGGFFTLLAYALIYKQYLKQRWNVISKLSGKRSVSICVVAALACFACGVAVQMVAQSLFI